VAVAPSEESEDLPWQEALAYAVTGIRWADLDRRAAPDLEDVADTIASRHPGGLPALREEIRARRSAGEEWPHPLPVELLRKFGAAQWLAALTQLRRRLQLDPTPQRPVVSGRAPDAEERRLLAEVPPHHGH
jgi:hypothetical protein